MRSFWKPFVICLWFYMLFKIFRVYYNDGIINIMEVRIVAEFWEKEFTCPFCGNEFTQVRVFTSAIVVEKRDEDLKPYYKGVNYLYYQTVTCPKCYFTVFERDFGKINIPDEKRDAVKRVLENAKKNFGTLNLGKDRKPEDAVALLSIATAIYVVLNNRRGAAEAFLKLAWIFREIGDKKKELIALGKALKYFEEHYREDIVSDEEEPMILFYLGELNRRLGNKNEAVKWFSTLLNKYKGVSSPFVKAARENWQSVREG